MYLALNICHEGQYLIKLKRQTIIFDLVMYCFCLQDLIPTAQLPMILRAVNNTKLTDMPHSQFVSSFKAVYGLLHSVLSHHAQAVYKFIPVYLMGAKNILSLQYFPLR